MSESDVQEFSPTPADESVETASPVVAAPAAAPAPAKSRGPSLLHLGIVVVILGGGVLLTSMTSDVTQVSQPGIRVFQVTEKGEDGASYTVERPFLPEKVGHWSGSALEGLSQAERDILPKDTQGARRIYTGPAGEQIYCSIVLAGKDVTSIHRPELCLPGQGWTIQNEYTEDIPVPSAPGGNLDVMRMDTVRSVKVSEDRTVQARSIFAYWFVGKDRMTPYHWERIFWTTKDRVFHNTNHRWAYILIHAPVNTEGSQLGSTEPEERAMRLVSNFVTDVYPELSVH